MDMSTSIAAAAYRNTADDIDVGEYCVDVQELMEELLEGCSIAPLPDTTGYTRVLVDTWISFSDRLPGGSLSDYCSSAAVDAVRGYTLRLRDQGIADEMVRLVNAPNVLDPRRWMSRLYDNDIIDVDGALVWN